MTDLDRTNWAILKWLVGAAIALGVVVWIEVRRG